MKNKAFSLSPKELIPMMALISSIGALSIDAILPALGLLASQYSVSSNQAQYIISSIFLGMSVGQLFYGPMSDSYGRKPTTNIGLIIFIVGCIINLFASSFSLVLVSRFIQGLGISSTRINSTAIIRDQYHGDQMAKIMSLIMVIFVLVPALAPLLGKLVIDYLNWQSLYYLFIGITILAMIWFNTRLEETLSNHHKKQFNLTEIKKNYWLALSNPTCLTYTIASGLSFGAFIGYLNSTAQIFKDIFNQEENFPLYFGLLALAIGVSSFINSKLVAKYGMKRLVKIALTNMLILSCIYLILLKITELENNLALFIFFLSLIFFNVGILFGNFNSLAIEPLGQIAGTASSAISSLQTITALIVGTFIGQAYNQTVYPLFISFVLMCFLSLILIKRKALN